MALQFIGTISDGGVVVFEGTSGLVTRGGHLPAEISAEEFAAEEAARRDGDLALGQRIDTERGARETADTRLETIITTETQRAEASENTISGTAAANRRLIDGIETRVETLESDSGPGDEATAQSQNEMIATPTAMVRIYQSGTDIETIEARADLDGDYDSILGLFHMLPSRLIDATSIRIYVQGSDLSTTEVHRVAWTRVQGRRRVPFSISTSEESGAGGKIQRDSNGRFFYHFVFSFWDASQEVASVMGTLWVENETLIRRFVPPPGSGPATDYLGRDNTYRTIPTSTSTGGADQTARTAAQTAQNSANAAQITATRAEGKADSNKSLIDTNTNTLTMKADQTALNTEITNRTNADTALGQRISSVERGFIFDPPYWLRTADARTIVLHLNDDMASPGTTHIRLSIAGGPQTVAFTSGDTDYSFNFTAIQARNILNNLGSETTVPGNIEFLRNGSVLATHQVLLRVLASAPAGLTVQDVTNVANQRAAARYTDGEKSDVARIDAIETTANTATTPSEATNIANARALARYPDSEKTAVGTIASKATITRLANEAAYTAITTKDANTIYWWPA